MQSDLGMHREGKIDRRRSFRQLNHVAGRSEDEDFVLIEIELEELEKFVGSLRVELELEHLPEPL